MKVDLLVYFFIFGIICYGFVVLPLSIASIVLGVTDDACIIWMKQPENQKVVELIKKETYPEMYTSEKDNDTKKIK